MLTRFTCNSSNRGMTGFFNAIIATATAGAGTTPSTPTGCNSFEVLGNTVAGGWTKIAPSGNVDANTTTVSLCAASPKAFTDGTKKFVKFVAGAAYPSTVAHGTIVPYVGRASSSNVELDSTSQAHTTYTTSSSTSSQYYSWNARRAPYYSTDAMNGSTNSHLGGDFLCAATAEYLWVFWGPIYNNSAGWRRDAGYYTLWGCADHTRGYNWEYAPNSPHCPWYSVGIYQRINTNPHSSYNQYRTLNGYYMVGQLGYHRHVDFTDNANNSLMSAASYSGTYYSAFTHYDTNITGYYHEYDSTNYGTSVSYQNADSLIEGDANLKMHANTRDYDNSGNAVLSINPLIAGKPAGGRPYREIKGLKAIGWMDDTLTNVNALPYHMTDIQSNDNTPKNYRCFLAGGKMLWGLEKV